MAIIIRKKAGFISGTITDNPLLIGATTFNSAALASVPEVASPDIVTIVLDPVGTGGAPEIAYITAHTAAATVATISRAAESTTARQHASAITWFAGPTSKDFFPDNTTAGHLLTCTDANSGIPTWVAPADKLYTTTHTWTIAGEVKVPSGDTDFICPFFVAVITGETLLAYKCKYIINSGTSATVKLQLNGGDMTGFTAISVTSTAAETNPADVALVDGDKIALVVTAVSGTPKNMSFSLQIAHTQ